MFREGARVFERRRSFFWNRDEGRNEDKEDKEDKDEGKEYNALPLNPTK